MKTKYFDLARKLSKLSDHKTHQLGAVVVSGSRIIGVGYNKLKTHTRSTHPYKTLHAEMVAILNAQGGEVGADLYVYRETRSGVPADAKPCVYCLEFIKEAKIRNVFFSSYKGFRSIA